MTSITLVLTVLAILALLAALHPFTSYPLSLLVLRALRAGAPQAAPGPRADNIAPSPEHPRIAICLCVHNEAAVIGRRLANLLAVTEGRNDTEVLVYSDGSTDDTVAILQGFGPRITLHANPERHGKTFGMNQLVAQTRADLLVFTDAAVMMGDGALEAMLERFRDPAVGCVCARIVAVPPDADGAPSETAQTSVRYWAFDAWVRRLESEVASVMGAHGPLFAIRRALHVPPPADLLDDFMVSMSVLTNGHRVVQADDFVGFKAVAPKGSDEFARKARIACQSFNAHRHIAPARRGQSLLIRYLYASHKTLKWLCIYWLALAALAASAAGISAGLSLWVLGAWTITVLAITLGWLRVRPFSFGFAALSALVGTGLGVWQSLRGQRYQTWASPQSARHTG
ncbi:MAG: glycosyltransferase [Burkholderiaceae bacterium]